ncbi:hypothetical protein CN277_24205 [Bacillus cereus]|uniref:hypothetical protein n=1 Tax=Bacillus cereus TaxID=1396 RepID=UPI000BF9EFC9|nr:hypothetical protein [Bacillus cereus]PFC97723.1 hypothetical protein CN277_24205 [Bacillus cereus]
MLNELIAMDKDLKEFLCKQIFEKRNAVEMNLIFEGEDCGYSEQSISNGLYIFKNVGLINQPPIGVLGSIPGNYDFLIIDPRFNELKGQGYL